MYKQTFSYFKKHPVYTALVHLVGGIGLGFLLAYPIAQVHPVRYGIALLVVSLLGHLYAGMQKK